jgi:regulator of RNase E activity RraA/CMP-N-acetylneuraminic acid synthetase
MKTVAFLPAKGSSDRVQNKNMRLLDGKPLFLHTLEKLIACPFFDEVVLDTDSEEMIALAALTGCRIMRRDPALATNETDGHQLFMNEVAQTDADIVVQVLCTSPFIETATLARAVEVLKTDPSHDCAILVRSEKMYHWQDGRPAYNLAHIPNSVDLPDTVVETMGLYAMRTEVAKRLQRRIGQAPFLLQASPLEAVDVNWPEDAALADLIAAGQREQERKLLANLSRLVTSSMLSDILDDLGAPAQIVQGLSCASGPERVLGRAKTLRLRALRADEDFAGIYTALDTYRHIVPGDVIVVENEVSAHAYFGELNANLALRSGAVGAIIGGATRDSADVARLGFPVFAQGTTCQDVRKRATVDHMNQPIHLQGVEIRPGDLVFADSEGVVIIPRQLERAVIDKALEVAAHERRLLVDVAQGMAETDLVQKYGFF